MCVERSGTHFWRGSSEQVLSPFGGLRGIIIFTAEARLLTLYPTLAGG